MRATGYCLIFVGSTVEYLFEKHYGAPETVASWGFSMVFMMLLITGGILVGRTWSTR